MSNPIEYGDLAVDSLDVPDGTLVFTTYGDDYGIVPPPVAASAHQPAWADHTVREPVQAALDLGWVVRTPAELRLYASGVEGRYDALKWDDDFHRKAVSTHHPDQAGEMPLPVDIVKFHSYWSVRLPDGYSALLTEPFAERNPHFTPFSGCIDFDVFPTITHAPTLLRERVDTEMKEGAPLLQVIPFDRENQPDTATVRDATPAERDALDASAPTDATATIEYGAD